MRKLNSVLHSFNAYVALMLHWIGIRPQPCWLIGGHSGNLYLDNARAFHEYLLQEQRNLDVYWVVNANAPARSQIPGKVLIKGSVQNYLYMYRAKVALFSDTFNSDIAPFAIVLPLIRRHYFKCFKVYLGHGTIGFKKMVQPPSRLRKLKKAVFSSYDLAIAATQLEVDVMEGYGINSSAIYLVGSARHDSLISKPCERSIILVAPTWRPWIQNKEMLNDSKFLVSYKELLSNSRLIQFLESNEVYVDFYLHHMFSQYHAEFTASGSSHISILRAGANVSDVIKKAKLMVTDYSSMSSDFYYLQKPILFFQFDRSEYANKVGSEIDLESHIFGDVCFDVESLIDKIIATVDFGFPVSKSQIQGEQYFVNYKDNSNCERIYNLIQQKL